MRARARIGYKPMMILSILRVIKFAFQDILRNISLAFMTVVILVLMLLSVNTLLFIRLMTGQAIQSVKEHIDVSIFFSPQASPKQIDEARKYVASFPEVTRLDFQTSEDVYKQFRQLYAHNPQILASLEELKDNPLGPTMIVQTRDPIDYQKIIKALSVPEYSSIIEAKTFGDTETAIRRIHVITSQVEKFSIILVSLFGFIAFLVIFNTIRVSIYTQRAEINIKKLVGATNWFVRGPYLVESVVFSLLAVLMTAALVYPAARWLEPYVTAMFNHPAILTTALRSHIVWLFVSQFTGVLLLTVFSSALAMRKHLKI